MDVGSNKIGREQALNLVSIFKQKDQMKSVGLAACDLGIDGAKAVADYVSVSPSLTCVDVRSNQIGGDSASQLSAAVLANTNIDVFNQIPIREMRTDSLTELNLDRKSIGVEGGMVVAGLIPVMASLTNLS